MSGNPLLSGLAPMHPGELLREVTLPALDTPKAEIARMLGVSRQTLYDLIDEKQPVTPNMALRLGKLFGNSASFWLNLQQAYDLRTLEVKMAEELAAIPTLEAADPHLFALARSTLRSGGAPTILSVAFNFLARGGDGDGTGSGQ